MGKALTALRGWRPISAVLRSRSFVLCSGTEEFPTATTLKQFLKYSPKSIGKTAKCVNRQGYEKDVDNCGMGQVELSLRYCT